MWLVAGLGNPGATYRPTRHNVGFRAANRLAARDPSARWQERATAHVAQARLADQRVLLLKPQTYMNRSGEVVAPTLADLDLPPTALLVLHDDVDLPLGRLKVKAGGGHGGHNGLKSLMAELDARDFVRIRLGVGRPEPGGDVVEWVLGAFTDEEQAPLTEMLDRAVDAALTVLTDGAGAAANRFNAAPRPSPKPGEEDEDAEISEENE